MLGLTSGEVKHRRAIGQGGDKVKIQIFQIKVNDGRRKIDQEAVHELADSISKVGLMNPIIIVNNLNMVSQKPDSYGADSG